MPSTNAIAKLVASLELNSAQFRKEMDKARKQTDSFSKETKKADGNIVAFGRSMRGAAQGISAFNGPLNGVSGRITSVNSLLTSGALKWAGLGAAIAGSTALLAKSISIFEQVEQQQLKTEAILKATEHAAGRTAAQLDSQARAVALNTLASTQGIREAQQVLLTFRSVQTAVFDRAIVLSQDLAAVMGGTAKSAALQLGKALESPATGLTALTRSGVSFSDAEKEVIKKLEETGRVAEAQTLVLDKLASQVGGAGSAAAGGLSGAADTLGQRWEELLEEIGKTSGVATIAKSGLDILSNGIKGLTDFINPEPIKRHNELHTKLVEIEERRRELEQSAWPMTARRGAQINRLKQEEIELRREIQSIMNDEVERQKELMSAQVAAEAEAKEQKKAFEEAENARRLEKEAEKEARDAEKREIEKQRFNDDLLERATKIEKSHFTEEQIVNASYQRRLGTIFNANKMGLITDQKFNSLKFKEKLKLEKDLRTIELRRSSEKEQLERNDWNMKVDYANRGANALISIGRGQSKTLFKVGKALSLATAAATLPSAVINAFRNAGGLPFGAFAAAATLAEGLAQIQSIRSTSLGSDGGGSVSVPPPISTPSVNIAEPTLPSSIDEFNFGTNETETDSNLEPEKPATKIVNINLEEDELYSSNTVRRLIESINEEVGNNVRVVTG